MMKTKIRLKQRNWIRVLARNTLYNLKKERENEKGE